MRWPTLKRCGLQLRIKKAPCNLSPKRVKNILSEHLIASGFCWVMNASNRLDFSGMSVNGFDYAGDWTDHVLPDFPTQLPGSGTLTVQGNVSSVCTTTDVLAWPLSYMYGGPLLRPRPPRRTCIDFKELEWQKDSWEQCSMVMLWTNDCKEIENTFIEGNSIQTSCQPKRKSEAFLSQTGS